METSRYYKKYLKLYGPHFTKSLCEYAVSLMFKESGKITPFTKQQIDEKLMQQGVQLKYDKLHDSVYVANMCKADFLGDSVPNDDRHLCLYIKNVIDDPDGYDGQPFYRWLTDVEKTGTEIDWSEFV